MFYSNKSVRFSLWSVVDLSFAVLNTRGLTHSILIILSISYIINIEIDIGTWR
jgi:membrane-bound metal-dependent hydrolase YbcI (DUF457 family)